MRLQRLSIYFQAIVALTFAQYATKPFFPECEPPDGAVRILAALCLGKFLLNYPKIPSFDVCFYCFSALLTAINCISTKLSMRVQNIFTAAKLFALISIILASIYFMATGMRNGYISQITKPATYCDVKILRLNLSFAGNLENFENPWAGKYDPSSIGFAFYSGLFAFGGWNYLNFVTGELIDPYK